MRRPLLALIATCLVASVPATAQSIAGEWNASMESPGGVRTSKLLLTVDGQKVTGTVKREAGDAALTGTMVGDTLRFSYTIVYNNNSLVMAVTALRSAEGLRGTVSFGGQESAPWWAVRAPPPSSQPPTPNP